MLELEYKQLNNLESNAYGKSNKSLNTIRDWTEIRQKIYEDQDERLIANFYFKISDECELLNTCEL